MLCVVCVYGVRDLGHYVFLDLIGFTGFGCVASFVLLVGYWIQDFFMDLMGGVMVFLYVCGVYGFIMFGNINGFMVLCFLRLLGCLVVYGVIVCVWVFIVFTVCAALHVVRAFLVYRF